MAVIMIGCTSNVGDFESRVNEAINSSLSAQIHNNKFKDKYISYYIDPSIGRVESNDVSHIFDYDGTKFVMNVNIENIINEQLYKVNEEDNTNDLFFKSGILKDRVEVEHPFTIRINDYNGTYLVSLKSDLLHFYSYSNEVDSPRILREMIEIARSVIVNKQAVVNAFNIKEVITYQPSYLDLFDNKVPENGSIEELLKEDDLLEEIEKANEGR